MVSKFKKLHTKNIEYFSNLWILRESFGSYMDYKLIGIQRIPTKIQHINSYLLYYYIIANNIPRAMHFISVRNSSIILYHPSLIITIHINKINFTQTDFYLRLMIIYSNIQNICVLTYNQGYRCDIKGNLIYSEKKIPHTYFEMEKKTLPQIKRYENKKKI